MNINYAYYTNKGDIRNNNEDSILANQKIINNCSMNTYSALSLENINKTIFAIADGMGGYEKGELASKIVLTALNETSIENGIESSLKEAKKELNSLVNKDLNLYGIGATLAGVSISETEIQIFNMGDCRVYRFSAGFLEKVSKDHSKVQVLFDLGEISEDEMRTHPNKNIVTSALSGDNKDAVDEIYFKTLKNKKKQIFFICSDGLWETLSIEELEECFVDKLIDSIATEILQKINEKVKNDNLSFIILEIE